MFEKNFEFFSQLKKNFLTSFNIKLKNYYYFLKKYNY